MYQLFAFLNGIILATLISVNGSLAARYPAFTAAAIIHAVGSLFALCLCILKKNDKVLWRHQPKWIYLGGAIGVITTISNNLAVNYISITSVIALSLFGQMVTSLVVDGFGLLGMKKRSFNKYSLIGILFSVLGMAIMIDSTITTTAFAIAISFGSGISMVVSRTVNARLSEKSGALNGSLVNHIVGLIITVIIAVLREASSFSLSNFEGPSWIYLGGILGVAVIMIYNIITPKISAFQLTTLVFIGQVFTGILLDIVNGNHYSNASFYGGIAITAGVAISIIIEHLSSSARNKLI